MSVSQFTLRALVTCSLSLFCFSPLAAGKLGTELEEALFVKGILEKGVAEARKVRSEESIEEERKKNREQQTSFIHNGRYIEEPRIRVSNITFNVSDNQNSSDNRVLWVYVKEYRGDQELTIEENKAFRTANPGKIPPANIRVCYAAEQTALKYLDRLIEYRAGVVKEKPYGISLFVEDTDGGDCLGDSMHLIHLNDIRNHSSFINLPDAFSMGIRVYVRDPQKNYAL